ncbi:quinon protein alcohol dehydrogenase-like superfamily [Hypoxylon cercidicola]|nr:quinon protein alcohol dehydrogenase-like superfamily [Hypoxylon cercidicola]
MKLIGHFVEADSKMTLEIQEEMVDQHKSLDGTAVAATVEAKIEQERARFTAELRNLETDLREALRKKDNDTMEVLREERAKYAADLAQIKADQESLRITMEKLHEKRYAQPEKAMKEQQKVQQAGSAAAGTSQTSRNSETAASGSTDKLVTASYRYKEIKIWDPATGRCLWTLQDDGTTAMSLSYDKTRLATGFSGMVKIWDLATKRCVSTLKGFGRVTWVAWSPNGMRLAVVPYDGITYEIQIWDLASNQCVSTLPCDYNTWRGGAWSPDGTQLASTISDRIIKHWDRRTRYMSATFEGHINPVGLTTWSPDDTRLALTGDGVVEIWDPAMRRRVSTLKIRPRLHHLMIWSPSGMKFAIGYGDGMVDIWDVATGRCELQLITQSSVILMAWSQDEKQFASGDINKTIKIWNVATGQFIRALEGHNRQLLEIVWSYGLTYSHIYF